MGRGPRGKANSRLTPEAGVQGRRQKRWPRGTDPPGVSTWLAPGLEDADSGVQQGTPQVGATLQLCLLSWAHALEPCHSTNQTISARRQPGQPRHQLCPYCLPEPHPRTLKGMNKHLNPPKLGVPSTPGHSFSLCFSSRPSLGLAKGRAAEPGGTELSSP